MDLGLSEQQEMLSRAAREFLEAECPTTLVRELEDSDRGYSPELWRKMADLGWLGQAFPGQYGGSDGTLIDQVALFEEIGRAILPSPILTSTVLCGQTILYGGSEDQKASLLPLISRGDTIATLALAEAGAGFDGGDISVTATADGGDYVINGTKLFVPYAHVADYLLCVARTSGGDSLFLIDSKTPGVNVTLLQSVAKYKQHEVALRDVRVPGTNMVGQLDQGRGPLGKAVDWATVVQCGEIVGRSQKVLDLVVDYSKVRVQFGRPIGSFQAVQHQCADLRVAVDGARLVTYEAAWKLAEGRPCSEDIAIAKAFAGSASRQATAVGHGIFAGIAFTVEHDMQLYMMRSKIQEANLGDTDFHLDNLGGYMGFPA